MILSEEIKNRIKSVYWDYNVDPVEIYLTIIGRRNVDGFFTKEKILLRLIERLSWYELIDLLGKEYLTKNLNKTIIEKIRNPQIRNKYESIRKILQGEAVSTAGWSDQNRKRLKASILSDRRYGS
jgi:hypothetical protein